MKSTGLGISSLHKPTSCCFLQESPLTKEVKERMTKDGNVMNGGVVAASILRIKTFVVCSVFMVVGPSLMLLNKEIMDSKGINFPYPFFTSAMGLVFTTIITVVMKQLNFLELKHSNLVTWSFWAKKILPVGVCHAATLAFGNAQYLYMGVALIQFLKAFTPMVVTLFSYILLKKSVSSAVWLALAIACFGTSLTAVGDMRINLFGLLLAAGSSSTEAIRLVLTQFCLQDCKFSLLEGQYYLAPVGAFWLMLLSAVFEFPKIQEVGDFGKVSSNLNMFLLAGSLGFGVQILTSSVIQLTSSITVKVLSQLRNALVVLSGVFFYSEVVTETQLLGYVISVVGISRYSYLQTLPAPTQYHPVSQSDDMDDVPMKYLTADGKDIESPNSQSTIPPGTRPKEMSQ